jgi:transcriptional regulator with XRE-family HTH domain
MRPEPAPVDSKALIALTQTLKARRAELGLSLTHVSERSGLTRQVISKLEIGTSTNPTIETISRYATALDAKERKKGSFLFLFVD